MATDTSPPAISARNRPAVTASHRQTTTSSVNASGATAGRNIVHNAS